LLRLDGVTDDSIEVIRERLEELLNSSEFQARLASEGVVEEAEVAEATEAEAEPETLDVAEAVEQVEEPVETPAEEEMEELEAMPELVEAEAAIEEVVEEEPAEEMPEEEQELVLPIDDLSVSLVDVLVEPEKEVEEEKGKDKKVVVVARPAPSLDQGRTEKAAERPQRGKQLVFDEDSGRVVVKRKRKSSRHRPEWEGLEVDDVDELLEDEF
jgi:hypothetical protein